MALTKVTSSVLDQYAVFPSGTVMLFQQTSAPTGWTKQTTHNDKALRVVSGSTSTGGSVAFSSAFVSQSVAGSISGTVGSTTLSTTQIPSHYHSIARTNSTTSGEYPAGGYNNIMSGDRGYTYVNTNNVGAQFIGSSGGGGSHDHGFSGSFSGTSINMAVQYVDVIFATKD